MFRVILFLCFFTPFLTLSQSNIFDIARKGSVSDVEKLMKINPDTINTIDKNTGYTPLILACYNGNKDVAKFLIRKVKTVDAKGDNGTALMATVFKGDVELTKMLLDQNANPNKADVNGATALHYAVISRNVEIIKLLIKHDVDVALKNNRGLSAKDYASMTKNKDILDLFDIKE